MPRVAACRSATWRGSESAVFRARLLPTAAPTCSRGGPSPRAGPKIVGPGKHRSVPPLSLREPSRRVRANVIGMFGSPRTPLRAAAATEFERSASSRRVNRELPIDTAAARDPRSRRSVRRPELTRHTPLTLVETPPPTLQREVTALRATVWAREPTLKLDGRQSNVACAEAAMLNASWVTGLQRC